MLSFRVAATLIVLGFLFARNANAFIDPPYLSPENPVADEVISVNIHGGGCDSIVGMPGYPQISRNGNALRILFWSASYTDPILCIYGVGTSTDSIGAYPAGSYTLQIDREYFGDLGGIQTETLGIIQFTVSGPTAEPAALPALNFIGSGVLILALAAGIMRRRRHTTARIFLAATLAPLAHSGHARTASPGPEQLNQRVELIATNNPSAPTPERIIAQIDAPAVRRVDTWTRDGRIKRDAMRRIRG